MPTYERFHCFVCDIETNYLRFCQAGKGNQCGFRTKRWQVAEDPMGRILDRRIDERNWVADRMWEKQGES